MRRLDSRIVLCRVERSRSADCTAPRAAPLPTGCPHAPQLRSPPTVILAQGAGSGTRAGRPCARCALLPARHPRQAQPGDDGGPGAGAAVLSGARRAVRRPARASFAARGRKPGGAPCCTAPPTAASWHQLRLSAFWLAARPCSPRPWFQMNVRPGAVAQLRPLGCLHGADPSRTYPTHPHRPAVCAPLCAHDTAPRLRLACQRPAGRWHRPLSPPSQQTHPHEFCSALPRQRLAGMRHISASTPSRQAPVRRSVH